LHHVEPKLFFDLIHIFELFEFELVFEFELSSLEKIKGKAIGNLGKLENCISAQPAQSIQAGPRAPAPPDRWTPSVSGGFLAHALSSPSLCLVGLACRRQSPSLARPCSLSASWAQLVSTPRCSLHAPVFPRCAVGPPCQFRLPREPPWTSAHARQEPRPHRLPTHPSSLLSTARTRSLSPDPFRVSSLFLSLALPSLLALAGDPSPL
jgi:hypothetical protein